MLEPAGEVAFAPQPAGASQERWARWSLVLLCAALPWTIAPMSITTGLLVAVSLLIWGKSPTTGWERTPVDVPALAWAAALVLSTAFALDRAASVTRLPKALFPLLVPLVATRARDAVSGRRALASLLVSALGAAIFGVVVWLVHGAGFGSRARGAVGHYMTYAGQLLLVVSAACGVAWKTRGRWRALALAVAATGGVALAATFTRGAWVGLAVSLATLVALLRPRLLPALAVLTVVAFVVMPSEFRVRALSSLDPRDRTSLERTYMWRAGVRMFLDHPLTGVGLEDLKPVYARYRVPEAREPAGHLHSVPVQIAATMGLAGIAAFAWLLVGLFRASAGGIDGRWRAGGLATGLRAGVTAGLAGFLAAGLFEWNFGDEELLYLLYTLAGLAWAARSWPAPSPAGARARAGATGRTAAETG